MLTKNLGFYIKKCMGSGCKSESEIDKFVSDIELQGWHIQETIDFDIYSGEKPVYKIMNEWGQWLLSTKKTLSPYLYLEYHGIELEDNFVLSDQTSYEGSFYQLGKKIETEIHPDADPGLIFHLFVYLQAESVNHRREVFNLMDLIGDLGGVMEFFYVLFGVLINPI